MLQSQLTLMLLIKEAIGPLVLTKYIFNFAKRIIKMKVKSNLNSINNNLNWKIHMHNRRRLTVLILDVSLLKLKEVVVVGRNAAAAERSDIVHEKIKSVHLKNMKRSDLRAMSCNRSLLA
jgi:hypothetical protein